MLIAMLFGCQEQSYDKGESISNINLFEVYEEEEISVKAGTAALVYSKQIFKE